MRYLVRTRREYLLVVEAGSEHEAHQIALNTDVSDWQAGDWEAQEVETDSQEGAQ